MTQTTQNEIEALVSLLSDEDPRIYEMVADHLRKLGASAIPTLEGAAESDDPRIRIRSRHLVGELRLLEVEQELDDLASVPDPELDLEYGCWLIARTEFPGLERSKISEPLDRLAEEVGKKLQGVEDPRDRIKIANHVLFEDWGFRRDHRNYYDPDNTFLNRVLELRTGVSVSLATLYVLVGKRLGLPIYAVGMPNAVLNRYGDEDTNLFFDPSSKGRMLTRRDLAQYLSSSGYYFKDGYVSNSTSRDLLIRTLQHLMVSYFGHDHGNRLFRYLERFRTRPHPTADNADSRSS